MSGILPLLKSHYSFGRSVLTLEDTEEIADNKPDSIIAICKQNDLKEVFLVEDSLSGFMEAYTNFSENNIKLNFGLRLTFCRDMEEKNEDSLNGSCKYVIFVKNTNGYKRLIKIFTKAYKNGYYYTPRIDFKNLKQDWDNSDLLLCVPFYDSFLYRNLLTNAICIPDCSFTDPVFFLEKNDLPFDPILKKQIVKYCTENKYEIIKTKSIYYLKEDDFKSYLTFRCINNRSALDKPQLDHMCSNKFSFESWFKQNEETKKSRKGANKNKNNSGLHLESV